jgi:hypothetical protein
MATTRIWDKDNEHILAFRRSVAGNQSCLPLVKYMLSSLIGLATYPKKINMKNIENEAIGYQQLIDEVEKEQAKMLKELKYVLTGVVGGRELSEQEFQCFYERAVNKYPFADIAFNLRISESACKTYYNRALKKLSKQATLITHLLRRK